MRPQIREDTPFNLSCRQWELILTEAEKQENIEQGTDRVIYLRIIIEIITVYLIEISKYKYYEIFITYDLVDTFRELQETIQ
jgi:hypothetical protein